MLRKIAKELNVKKLKSSSFNGIVKSLKVTVRNKNISLIIVCLVAFLTIGEVLNVTAQDTQFSSGKSDFNLRSAFTVNPSTLALELNIPLASYQGRAGMGVPIKLSFSSKVWQIEPQGNAGIQASKSWGFPMFAQNSYAGWNISTKAPRIDNTDMSHIYSSPGYPIDNTGGYMPPQQYPYVLHRLNVRLPNGSAVEMRKSDVAVRADLPANDPNGIYYAVDGSGIKLEYNSTINNSNRTLYLSDGSRYIWDSNGLNYVDKNGNKESFNIGQNQITDSLGRIISSDFATQWDNNPTGNPMGQQLSVGDKVYSLPGLNGGGLNYVLRWRKLKDTNTGETVLENPSDALQPVGSHTTCDGNSTGDVSPSLFTHPLACSAESNPRVFNPVVLSEIELPNGQKYRFKYNIYGEISKVLYPSGGYERFNYAQIQTTSYLRGVFAIANRGVVERRISVDGVNEQSVWTYSAGYTDPASYTPPYKVTINAPNGSRTERLLYSSNSQQPFDLGNGLDGMAYDEKSFDTNGLMVHRTLTQWAGVQTYNYAYQYPRGAKVVKKVEIYKENGASNALTKSSTASFDIYGNQTVSNNYNFVAIDNSTAETGAIGSIPSGNLLNSAETDYLATADYLNRWMTGYPTAARVKDQNGNIVSQSQIYYDEGAYPLLNSGSVTGWQDANTNFRGNLTTARSWLNTNNSWTETHAQYDNFGNPRKTWDAKGNVSEVEYASNYNFAYPTKTRTAVPDPSGQNGSSVAFETNITYDYATSLPLTTTDANGQVTTMQYNDPLLRPTKVIPPSGGAVSEMIYNDTPGAMWVQSRTQIDTVNWKTSTAYADGLGRTKYTVTSDNQGDVFNEMVYDNMGRVNFVSNPFRNGETKLWTETKFDVAGRLKEVVTPDGAKVQTSYDVSTSGILGTVTTVTDQANKQRRSVTNAIGQLMRVDEPDDTGNLGSVSAPTQPTNYQYSTIGKMVKVTQGVQARFFLYDSLGRLLRVRQPEQAPNANLNLSDGVTGNSQWTAGFTYDANGNLLSALDAKGVNIASTYDNLNRALNRTYSDGTPTVTYSYDNTAIPYSKGKLTQVSNSISTSQVLAFDNLGRTLASRQITDGVNYDSSYLYNLSGALVEETYPSGRKVKNTFETDGDLSKIETQVGGGAYQVRAQNLGYTASGVLEKLQIGNGLWETAQLNSRLQVTQLGLGTSPTDASIWKLNYDFGNTNNDGNIKSQTLTTPTAVFNQTFQYDSLDRLKQAQETTGGNQTWIQNFSYDRYGNRAGFNQTINGQTTNGTPSVDVNTNRFNAGQGYAYDFAGNVVQDSQNRQFIFNGDNKQVQVKDANNNVIGTYFYDADGKRIKKVTNAESTTFVYSGSKLVAEYTVSNVTPTAPTTQYLATDMLGSPRVITDQNAQVVSRRDFMPFGEDIPNFGSRTQANGYKADNLRQKFTGYQKDNETGLDFAEARYYNSAMGRFTAVDPLLASGKSANPQTFNRYVYSLNRPLVMTDPTGENGDFYDRDLNYIGTDGIDDGKYYYADVDYREQTAQNTIIHVNNVEEFTTGYRYSSGFLNNLDIGIGGGIRNTAYSWLDIPKYNFLSLINPAVSSIFPNATLEGAGVSPFFDYEQPQNNTQAVGNFVGATVTNITAAWATGKVAGAVGNRFASPSVTNVSVADTTAVHGNSLSSQKPTWGYKLFDNEGNFLKNGITSEAVPQTRYTKSFMSDKNMGERFLFPNRRAAYNWEFQQNTILRGPLNKNMH